MKLRALLTGEVFEITRTVKRSSRTTYFYKDGDDELFVNSSEIGNTWALVHPPRNEEEPDDVVDVAQL